MGLEGFCCLTKKQEDLLNKSYSFQTPALVTLKTSSGPLLFKARASQRQDTSSVAKASIQIKHGEVTLTPKRKTDGSSEYVLDYAPSADLNIRSHCKVVHSLTENSYETTVSAEYSKPSYKAKIAISEPNLALKATGTVGNERWGVAVDGKFDVASNRLVGYSFAQYWFEKEQRIVFKHVGSDKTRLAFGDFIFSYFQPASEKTAVAANVKYNYPRKETFIEFGGSHALTPDTELRGKVDSTGLLSGSFAKTFNPSVKLTLATQVDAKKVVQASVSDYKFGLRLDLNA